MSFDVAKWNKKRYLAEAGLLENEEADKLHDLIYDANPSYPNLAKALAKFLKGTEEDLDSGFSSDQIKDFMRILHAELGMEESLNEVEGSNIEKIDFSFVEGTTRFYGAYIYNKGSKNWDKKLRSSKEVQDFLTSLGITTEFDYYNLPEIFKELKAKGIKAEDSEFDVS
jgi:hypothetical protein